MVDEDQALGADPGVDPDVDMDPVDVAGLDGLDPAGVCAAVADRHAALVRAEAELFYLAAHWAHLHAGRTLNHGTRASGRLRGTERDVQIGADGTPLVGEFAAAELGALRGMGHLATRHYIRDALNVEHRHPRLWDAVQAGQVRVWQARQTAQLCAQAGLTLDQSLTVDAQTTPYAGALPWTRFQTLIQAKIIEADPAAAEQRRRAAALRRFVATGQSTEHGLKTLIARARAGDVIYFVAMVDRIAQILADHGDPDPADVRRSKAIGILATPERALTMLHTAATAATTAATSHPDSDCGTDSKADGQGNRDGGEAGPGRDSDEVEDPNQVAEADLHPSQNHRCPTCHGTGQASGDPAAFVRARPVDPKKLLPNATLYVHMSHDMLHPAAKGGVARIEDVGPATRQQVLDLADQAPVDGYEVPDRMAEALHLRNPACVSPWSPHLSRNKDKDHTRPYVPPAHGGPPGQTHLGNLGGLTRFAHRLKTHGRWRLHQPSPGTFEWQSPHGYHYRVDHTGTHALGKHPDDSPPL